MLLASLQDEEQNLHAGRADVQSRKLTSRWSRSSWRSWTAEAAQPHRAFIAASSTW